MCFIRFPGDGQHPGRGRNKLNKTLVFIEDGDEAGIGGIGFLEEAGEIQGQHMIPDAAVFAGSEAAIQAGDRHNVAGDVLAHEADRSAGRKIVPDPGQKTETFAGEAGENQVTDQCAAEHDSVRVVTGNAGLTAHFQEGGGSCVKIIGGTGAETSGPGRKMLEIRQVNIDDSVQETKGFRDFVARGIPDQGERGTPKFQGVQDLRDKRCGCNKGNGMDTKICQALEGIRKRGGGKRPSLVAVGDFSVLAVDAAESATGEKDGAGAAGTGNRGFLPEMRCDAADEHIGTETAEAGMGGTVDTAAPGAENTGHMNTAFNR